MKLYHWITLIVLLALATWFIYRTNKSEPRYEYIIDLNWKFKPGDPANAWRVDYDDSDWRFVSLPHDWMIEQQVNRANASGTAGGYYPSGIAWYRRDFDISEMDDKEQFLLIFEGVYMNADIYLNGKHLGKHVYGYSTFFHDVSDLIRKDTMNVIAVRTDCSKLPVDRWYSGAGIYRHVRLIGTEALYFPIWGCNVQSVLDSDDLARVNISLELINNSDRSERFDLNIDIIDAEGKIVAEGKGSQYINKEEQIKIMKELEIPDPQLWSPDNPYLYSINCYITDKKRIIDQISIFHGVRTADFDPDRGFILNGEKLFMKGVCLHHDGGELGAAITEAGWERRFRILKSLGVNSIRFAHNPHSPEVLDLCDRMGFLVIDEIYDKWELPWSSSAGTIDFADHWKEELKNFIRRDRNHPSVVLWSVGNEVVEQLEDPARGVQLYRELADMVRTLDPARSVTCALHPGYGMEEQDFPSQMINVTDIISYNYRTDFFEEWHNTYPEKVFIASETRAYTTDRPDDYHEIDFSENTWFDMADFVAGQFIWAGIDYLGESMGWPDRGFRHGLLQSNGFIKPYSYFVKSIYSDGPVMKLTVLDEGYADSLNNLESWQVRWAGPPVVDHWTFNNDSSVKKIVVFTNCQHIRLSLNDRIIDTLYRDDFPDGVIRKSIIYEPGTLSAEAYFADNSGSLVTTVDTLKSAGEPYAISMDPDRFSIKANGKDLVHITTKIVDSAGILNPHSRHMVNYAVTGSGNLKVIDNGDFADHTPYGSTSREVRNGMQLVVIQAGNKPGDLIISATADGLNSANVKIKAN